MSSTRVGGKVVRGLSKVEGPLVVVEGIGTAGYDEIVEVTDASGQKRLGKVLEAAENFVVLEVFSGTSGVFFI